MAADNAVALVRAYLQLNGYFTVTEYPVIEAVDAGGYRTVTDLDVLAFRFPDAGRFVPGREDAAFAPDPELDVLADSADLLIAEVKEGPARLNSGARDPAVLKAVLVRFGCCPEREVDGVVGSLVSTGRATATPGRVRVMAFGLQPDEGDEPVRVPVIGLGHVAGFLEGYLKDHWDVLRHTEFKDPAFGFLMTLEKARRDGERAELKRAAGRERA